MPDRVILFRGLIGDRRVARRYKLLLAAVAGLSGDADRPRDGGTLARSRVLLAVVMRLARTPTQGHSATAGSEQLLYAAGGGLAQGDLEHDAAGADDQADHDNQKILQQHSERD